MKKLNKKELALDNFLKKNDVNDVSKEKLDLVDEREGLIERVDKIFVTQDGKQLLREQY